MISRNNECFQFTTQEKIDAPKIMDFLESFSFNTRKETFLVLDNAAIHRAKCIRDAFRFGKTEAFISSFFLYILHI